MKGPSLYRNAAYGIVQEYFQRRTLAKLGFHGGPTFDLDWQKAEYFLQIHNEIEKIKDDEQKKAARKRGR